MGAAALRQAALCCARRCCITIACRRLAAGLSPGPMPGPGRAAAADCCCCMSGGLAMLSLMADLHSSLPLC